MHPSQRYQTLREMKVRPVQLEIPADMCAGAHAKHALVLFELRHN